MRSAIRITDKERAEIIALRKSGMSFAKIGKRFGCSRESIRVICQMLEASPGSKWTEEKCKKFDELEARGLPMVKIAKELGITEYYCRKRLLEVKGSGKRKLHAERNATIIELDMKGYSVPQISAIVEAGEGAVSHVLLSHRGRKRKPLNITVENMAALFQLRREGKTQEYIAKKLGLNRNAIVFACKIARYSVPRQNTIRRLRAEGKTQLEVANAIGAHQHDISFFLRYNDIVQRALALVEAENA